jgi:hypothetical protein
MRYRNILLDNVPHTSQLVTGAFNRCEFLRRGVALRQSVGAMGLW